MIQNLPPYDPIKKGVTAHCTNEGCDVQVVIPMTPEQHAALVANERCIQHIIPEVSEDNRELLMSGLCGACYDKLFAEDEEEHEA